MDTAEEGLAEPAPPARRRGRAGLWVALVAAVAGAVAVVAARDPGRSPEDDLARVRSFVSRAGTVRLEGTSRSEYGRGADKPGYSSVEITRIEGVLALPDRMRLVEDSGGFLAELINLPAGSYNRTAESRAELAEEPWVFSPGAEEDAVTHVVSDLAADDLDAAGSLALSAAADVFGAAGAPFDLVELLGRLQAVRRVEPGVLEARLTMRDLLPPDLLEALEETAAAADEDGGDGDDMGAGLDEVLSQPVTIRLRHAPDGRLDELSLTSEHGEGDDRNTEQTTLRFSGWGEPVSIEAPGVAEVDPTPGVDEDDLAAFSAFPVLAPSTPPAGMVLHWVEVGEADEDEELCASVDMAYGTPTADGEGGLWGVGPGNLQITLERADCPWLEDFVLFGEAGPPEAVQVGAWAGELREVRLPGLGPGDDEVAAGFPTTNIRFTVGEVVVTADTDLPREQALAVLATLAPLDLAAQPVERSEPPAGG